MLGRTGEDWLIAVIDLRPDDYELYFDDSGTDKDSPVAVAACYVAKKEQWDEFTRNWKDTAGTDGFNFFHMTDFMVNPLAVNWDKVKPNNAILQYRDWDDEKRRRVYTHLSGIIRCRAQSGFGVTVGKQDYDDLIPD